MNTFEMTNEPTTTVAPQFSGWSAWNWGAFGLTWIWGVAHRTYVSLLIFVPIVGWFVMPFVLGWKGNAWAWQNREWKSVEEFRRAQRSWGFYALIAWAGVIVSTIAIVFIVGQAMKSSEAFQLAAARLAADPVVAEHIGFPIEPGTVGGSVSVASSSGKAEIDFPVEGPKGTARAYVVASKELGQWSIVRMELELPDGRRLPIGEGTTP